MNYDSIMRKLESLSNPASIEGRKKYGITPRRSYGISIPALRGIARDIGVNHRLAQQLWESGIHEARILASMIDDPGSITEAQMESWVKDFDTWDLCDQCCSNLFDKTALAYQKAIEWSQRDEEFIRRAGFVLMACLAVHDKRAKDQSFLAFLPAITRGAHDNRNFVKKAINWALRQIGKRSPALNRAALDAATEIQKMDSNSARWIASDAIRELTSPAIQKRLNK